MGLVSMFCSDLGQSFEPPSRCSLVTQSPFYDVYLENIGEVLSKFCLRSEYQGGGHLPGVHCSEKRCSIFIIYQNETLN
jgi:hypothetical protein